MLTPFCLVIGTLRPNYFVGEIQQAYKKRKEKHDLRTEQYIEMCPAMMWLVSSSNQISKGKWALLIPSVLCR